MDRWTHGFQPAVLVRLECWHSLVPNFQLDHTAPIVQRQDGCWWFGQPGRRGVWNGMIVVFILVSVIDLFLLLIMALGGNEKSRVSARS